MQTNPHKVNEVACPEWITQAEWKKKTVDEQILFWINYHKEQKNEVKKTA